jgi:hypothetical protein
MTQPAATESDWLGALPESRGLFWQRFDPQRKAAESSDDVRRWIDFLKQRYSPAAQELQQAGHPALLDQLTALLRELESLSAMLKATVDREIKAMLEKSNLEIAAMQREQALKNLKAGSDAIAVQQTLSQQGPDVWKQVRDFQLRSDAMWRDVLARGMRRR